MNNTVFKISFFVIGLIFSLCLCLFVCYLQATIFDTDKLLNYTTLISAGIALVCTGLLSMIKSWNKFELFLMFFVLLFFNMLTIYIGPLTINRSLSAFVYLYTAENSKINRNIFEQQYFRKYVDRRFIDGEDFGFLVCDEQECRPNIRTKIFYNILMPVGKITKSDKHYTEFKNFMNN